MAKIDITKLDGYREDMTVEEKLELLNNYEIPEPSKEGLIDKALFDKTSSELALAKKQLKEKLTDEEKKAQELIEKDNLLKDFQQKEKLNSIALSLAKQGITENDSIAQKLLENDFTGAITEISTFFSGKVTELSNQVETLKMQNMQDPPPNGGQGKDKKISLAEAMEMINKEPTKFDEIMAMVK